MKVLVCADTLISWGGGRDFLNYYLTVLNLCTEHNVSVALGKDDFDQALIRKAKNLVKRILGRSISEPIISVALDGLNNIKLIRYRTGDIPSNILNSYDVVFLSMKPIKNIDNKSKVIGYIPDLQHKHLPHFFSTNEIIERDSLFKEMLQGCGTIFANSYHTQQDLKNTYPEQSKGCDIFSMKFLPFTANELSVNTSIVHYNLPSRYFMICSQLWVHKDHPTAFRAFAKLVADSRYNDIELVCSGSTYDYRNPNYFQEIKQLLSDLNIDDKVRFLGYIPKDEQIAILRNSISVIQPTLFEGGPGGGATYDAITYGSNAIISDIEINKEINNPRVSFFRASDDDDLCNQMKYRIDSPLVCLGTNDLKIQNESNMQTVLVEIKKLLENVSQNNSNNSNI